MPTVPTLSYPRKLAPPIPCFVGVFKRGANPYRAGWVGRKSYAENMFCQTFISFYGYPVGAISMLAMVKE